MTTSTRARRRRRRRRRRRNLSNFFFMIPFCFFFFRFFFFFLLLELLLLLLTLLLRRRLLILHLLLLLLGLCLLLRSLHLLLLLLLILILPLLLLLPYFSFFMFCSTYFASANPSSCSCPPLSRSYSFASSSLGPSTIRAFENHGKKLWQTQHKLQTMTRSDDGSGRHCMNEIRSVWTSHSMALPSCTFVAVHYPCTSDYFFQRFCACRCTGPASPQKNEGFTPEAVQSKKTSDS